MSKIAFFGAACALGVGALVACSSSSNDLPGPDDGSSGTTGKDSGTTFAAVGRSRAMIEPSDG